MSLVQCASAHVFKSATIREIFIAERHAMCSSSQSWHEADQDFSLSDLLGSEVSAVIEINVFSADDLTEVYSPCIVMLTATDFQHIDDT
jgi:hypothetical protein